MAKDRTASFPPTDSAESDAVTIFKYLLDTDVVKFDANTRDKIPAVDGDLYLVDENDQIKGKLLAQVKKLPDRNRDSPKKQFDLATLNHYTVDPAPFLLIVVDLNKEVAYWEHIDSDFVEKMDISEDQKTKTIHFSDEKVVDDEDKSYIRQWRRITEERMDTVLRDEKYREAYEKLRKKANPAIGIEQEFYPLIHAFLDEFNRLVKHDMPILNKRFYGNAWKIGLAVQIFDSDSVDYGLYPIPWRRNDVQIKEVEGPVFEELDEVLVATGHFTENPIQDRPEEYAREKVHDMVEDVLKDRMLIHGVNRYLAREYIFEFVDEYNDPLGLDEGKDMYQLEELKKGFYQYLPLWVDEAVQVIQDRGESRVIFDRDGIDLHSLQMQISTNECEEMDARIQERMEQEDLEPASYYINTFRFSLRTLEEHLVFLEQRGIESIERLYIPPDYSRLEEQETNLIWGKYSPEAVEENIDILFSHLPETFEAIVEENFPGLVDELSLFGGASKIVVTYEVSESYDSKEDAPTMCLYHFTNDEEDTFDILVSHDKSSRFYKWIDQNKLRDKIGDTIEFDGTSFELQGYSSKVMDHLYQETPMLNFIYEQIGNNIGNSLDVDETIFAGRLY